MAEHEPRDIVKEQTFFRSTADKKLWRASTQCKSTWHIRED